MVLVLESSRCRAEAGSRYNGGHWRRIIRTASASGLSAQWSPVQGQGRNSQLFSAILPSSHYWSALKRTRTFSDNITGTYARPAAWPCNWARFCTLQKCAESPTVSRRRGRCQYWWRYEGVQGGEDAAEQPPLLVQILRLDQHPRPPLHPRQLRLQPQPFTQRGGVGGVTGGC